MDHHDAIKRGVVEKYLLNELSPSEREEFEEHYFDCRECAEDLRAAAAFLDGAKRELKRGFADKKSLDKKSVDTRSRFGFLWRPAFLSPAMAALLLVIVYQNAVVYPRLAADAAASKSPEILAPVSLIGGNSRGAAIPSITLMRAQPLLLSLDIPTAERFTAYTCVLVAPSGAIVWRVPVSAEQAKDTVSIRIPAGEWQSGEYRLIVQGHSASPEQQPAELARYRFTLNSSH